MTISINNYNQAVNSTQNAISTSIKRIATGLQYNSPSDGAAAYSILARMYSNIDTAATQTSNAQNSSAMLSTAADGVTSTMSVLDNMRSSLTDLLNSPTGSSRFQQVNKEISDSISQVDALGSAVQFNGKSLLDGTQSTTVSNGSGGYASVAMPNLTSQALGLTDKNGKSTLDLSSTDGIQKALDTVSNAYDTALSAATSLGAAQQNLTYSAANSTTTAENLTSAASTMGDTDIAKEVTNLKSAQTQNAFALFASKLNMHSREAALSMLQ